MAGLTNGESYVFELSAVNSVGVGPAGVAGPVMSTADIPSAPTRVAAKLTPTGDAVITWETRGEGLRLLEFRVVAASTSQVSPATASFSTSSRARSITIPASSLGLDEDAEPDFTFRVTSVAEGASGEVESAASEPSRAVDPFMAPAFAPELVPTVVDGDAGAQLSWPRASHGGRPVAYRVVCRTGCSGTLWDSATNPVGDPVQASLAGLANGATYELGIVGYHADNRTTRELVATVRPHRVPTVTISGNGSSDYRSAYVSFGVDGHGSTVTCFARGPAQRQIGCGGNETFSVEPYRDYTAVICAVNDRGEEACASTPIRAQDPPTAQVTVAKPELGFNRWAIRSAPSQTSQQVGHANEGDVVTMICQRRGTNPYGFGDVWTYISRSGLRGWISPGFGNGVSSSNFDSRVTQYCPPGV
jgi:hypothetical protein